MSITHDEESIQRGNRNLKEALGPVIIDAINNPEILDIMLNDDGNVFVEEFGKPMRFITQMPRKNAERVLNLVATALGMPLCREHPSLEGELPIWGYRFAAMSAFNSPAPNFSIRKPPARIYTLEEYVEEGILTRSCKDLLDEAIRRSCNIIIAGGTGSGKTTFANAMLDAIGKLCPHSRVITIEDTYELQIPVANKVRFRTSEYLNMHDIVKSTLRFNPDRIIPGEVRDGSAFDLLKAWNTGHSGGLATVHANNARETLKRLSDLASEATIARFEDTIADAIDIVVYIEKTMVGRRITEIARVLNYDHHLNQYNIDYVFRLSGFNNDEDKWWEKYKEVA